jgi:hypothetical protein
LGLKNEVIEWSVVFVAVELPEEIRENIRASQEHLKKAGHV